MSELTGPVGRVATLSQAELDAILAEDTGVCERHFKSNDEKLTILMAMCIGLNSRDGDGRALGDTLVEPYKSMKFRKKVVPTQKHMSEEICRRAVAMDAGKPTCKYWTKDKMQQWLTENQVKEPEDVVFLIDQEKKLFDTVNRARTELSDAAASNNASAGSWRTNEPYLRMYHCMFCEEVRDLLMKMNDVMDRPVLDARNSSERPETFFEAVARIFNDPSVDFYSECLPDLHYAFTHSMTLAFEDMPGPMDAEECKRRFADGRAKLIKIISKWELSGNGFGQRTVEDEDFGHLGEEEFEAGDNRGNFLDSMTKEHILYFWHLADQNELLKNVLCIIADTSSADSENFQTTSDASSTVVSNARRRTAEAAAANDFRLIMGRALTTMSVTAMMQELRSAEAQAMRYQELLITTDNERLQTLYQNYASREQARINDLQAAVNRVKRRRVCRGMVDSSDDESVL
jgi:hypothetical protein